MKNQSSLVIGPRAIGSALTTEHLQLSIYCMCWAKRYTQYMLISQLETMRILGMQDAL